MLRAFLVLLSSLAVCMLAPSLRAAHDIETAAISDSNLELIVVEAEGCIYCQIFRRDVLPAYRASPRAKEIPIRFVDLNQPEAEKLPLAEPVSVIPTAVLLKNRREVGRIDGYVGPEAFFHSIARLLSQLD